MSFVGNFLHGFALLADCRLRHLLTIVVGHLQGVPSKMDHLDCRAGGDASRADTESSAITDSPDVSVTFSGLVRALAASGGLAAGRDIHVAVNVEIVVGDKRRPRVKAADAE